MGFPKLILITLIMCYMFSVFANKESSDTQAIILEQAIGATGTFRERCRLYPEYIDKNNDGIYELKLRYTNRGSILATETETVHQALRNHDILRLRVRMNSSNDQSLYIYTSTKLCLLAAVEYKHDVYFTLDSTNFHIVRNIDIRLPVGAPSVCSGYHSTVPSAGFDLPARYAIVNVDDSPSIPVITSNKGVPYPGQRELSPADILTASTGTGVPLDKDQTQLLQNEAEKEKATESKGFFSGYWPYIIGGYIVMQMLGGGAQAAAGGAGGGRPARGGGGGGGGATGR